MDPDLNSTREHSASLPTSAKLEFTHVTGTRINDECFHQLTQIHRITQLHELSDSGRAFKKVKKELTLSCRIYWRMNLKIILYGEGIYLEKLNGEIMQDHRVAEMREA